MTLAYQLYSSRKFGPLLKTCADLAKLGYRDVEAYGDLLDDDGDALGLALAKTGLRVRSAHIGLDVIEARPAAVIEMARTLGLESVFVPHVAAEDRPTDAAGWAAFGARLEVAGRPLREAGLRFGWHNHDFEFMSLPDGTLPIEALLGGTELVLEMDVAWIARAGADPATWIDRLAPRIVAVHLKDIAPAGENSDEDGWADPGTGVLDWAAYVPQLRAAGVDRFIAEHDNPSDDMRFAKAALDFHRALKGA